MNTNNNLSIGQLAAALAGAGLTQITTDLNVALILIGVGVALEVLRSVLNRQGFDVSSQPLG